MKSLIRLATCLLFTAILGLSACVFAGPRHDDRGASQSDVRADHDQGRQDDRAKGCDSDHPGDGCQNAGHP